MTPLDPWIVLAANLAVIGLTIWATAWYLGENVWGPRLRKARDTNDILVTIIKRLRKVLAEHDIYVGEEGTGEMSSVKVVPKQPIDYPIEGLIESNEMGQSDD